MGFFLCFLLLFQGPQFANAMFGPQPMVERLPDNIYAQCTNIYQLVFLANELLDPRELRYVFAKPTEFLSDWKMMQRRMTDLQTAPYLCDSIVFPERTAVNDLLMFNRAYRQHIENCLNVWKTQDFRTILDETEYLYKLWDCVRDARCEYYYVHIRRQALLRLKTELDKIDPTWYSKGIMPPHVPLWRFTHIR